ncbi:hypothetical protein OHB05_00960 [Streptomyces sp. NBC_00638]|uniref:hypothetical protein n=1 Tax=unclassified Streptomyces TaxID=2593676 RepID=UPI0022544B9D|nr:hypothetical protein [Streptomyces sp. NBC_00638]MCX5001199.1 hypothetical protein [Streptomyces sp. NBC_00638]
MQDHLKSRLAELQQEYQLGEGQLRKLVEQEAGLREALLRISGAVQMLQELQELLSRDQENGDGSGSSTADRPNGTAKKPQTEAEPAAMTVPS